VHVCPLKWQSPAQLNAGQGFLGVLKRNSDLLEKVIYFSNLMNNSVFIITGPQHIDFILLKQLSQSFQRNF
jgi:hypothetical protein